jgi:hypothetical protein
LGETDKYMPQDFYGEGDEGASTSTAQAEPEHDDKEGMEDKDEGETALVPKSMFMGKELKPDDEFIFKIVKDHGEEVEIKYSTGKDESAEKPKRSQMDESGDALERMGKPATGGY